MSSETERVTLRPAVAADRELLLEIYASTRERELVLVPWTSEQKLAFLRMQFDAQCAAYEQYANASFDIVLVNGVAAGRLYVARWEDEIRIVDITLLPGFRARGIGGRLLGQLIDEGQRTNKPLRIHVERENPARRLYERLGFTLREDKGLYLFLERRPSSSPAQ